MASTQGSAPVPTGCYKCGRPGHWSRDCPALPRGAQAAAGDGPGASGGGSSASGGLSRGNDFSSRKSWESRPFQGSSQSGSYNKKELPKEITVKEPRKRPKLTDELLLSENGLGYVLEKIPRLVTIKGREDTVVSDLKRLLEGYMHWHSRLLPYFSFDQFVEKVEKIGSSRRVRACIRELREKVSHGQGIDGEVDGDKGLQNEAVPKPDADDPLSETTAVGSETAPAPSEVHLDDIFTSDEPTAPVNQDEFEAFYRQGVLEAEDSGSVSTWDGASAAPRPDSSSERPPMQSLSVPVGESTPQSTPSVKAITEAAKARMAANRLLALERAKSRALLAKET